MTNRDMPPKIKIIEALSAVADDRIKNDALLPNEWKCLSSSTPWKIYTIFYDEKNNAISSNDSWTIIQHYLWYPAIAFLLKIWKIDFDKKILEVLKNIDWSKLKSQTNKNYEDSFRLILWNLHLSGYDVDFVISQVEYIYNQLLDFQLKKLN